MWARKSREHHVARYRLWREVPSDCSKAFQVINDTCSFLNLNCKYFFFIFPFEDLCRRFKRTFHRFTLRQNKTAAKQLRQSYDVNVMGKMMREIYMHHFERDIMYELSEEAEEVYENICEKYNDQFNLKWSGNICYYLQIYIC